MCSTMAKHHGVGVIITNPARELFYIQKKDNSYPIKKYRLKHSIFGGAIEAGESEISALERELREELRFEAAHMVFDSSKKLFDIEIPNEKVRYDLTLFESVLSPRKIEIVSSMHVKEGIGDLVGFQEFRKLDFIHNLRMVIDKYLQSLTSGYNQKLYK